ncbi:hypothetical protein [Polyangium sp. 6x1]|uniref:hypothetical protein n=1 Tax=Polyangium sp. 6x1 TaxID=3042689 RepID=UPI002482DC66|nr:hypothetical protein [Polyangium sp. 6x1]MDI1442476.1 hypothetical protein [Polyangium sp. 6x1]
MSGTVTLTSHGSTKAGQDTRLSVEVEGGRALSIVTVILEHESGAGPLLPRQTKDVRVDSSGHASARFTVNLKGTGHAIFVAKAQDTQNTFFKPSSEGVEVR